MRRVIFSTVAFVLLLCGCLTKRPDTSKDYFSYRDFGAKGNGKTDDFDAIVATHEAANAAGKKVRATPGAVYYIGGARKTARIRTDTDWTGAEFIIDDTKVAHNGFSWQDSWVFEIASGYRMAALKPVPSLQINQEKLDIQLPQPALVVAANANFRQYIRRGENESSGTPQTDVFILDRDGNVHPDAPIIWNFESVTSMISYPIDEEVVTVTGGKFTTIANRGSNPADYMSRGIHIVRSNTVLDGIRHEITGEGNMGSSYQGFIRIENCMNVVVKNTTLTGHRVYRNPNGVQQGTYDITAVRTVNSQFINCDQTNSITNDFYWGIFASDYSKNMFFDNVKFSRFDAHQGVHNVTILNSEFGYHGIRLVGSGLLRVENTTVYTNDFIGFRGDYGSTWNGDVIIRNGTLVPPSLASAGIIGGSNDGQWWFGYDCSMPETITIEGFTVVENNPPANFDGILLFLTGNSNETGPYPYTLTKRIYISGFESSKPWRLPNDYLRNNITVVNR